MINNSGILIKLMKIYIFLIILFYTTSYSMEDLYVLDLRLLRYLKREEIQKLEEITSSIQKKYDDHLNCATDIACTFISTSNLQFNAYLNCCKNLKTLTNLKEDINSILKNRTTFDSLIEFQSKIDLYAKKVNDL